VAGDEFKDMFGDSTRRNAFEDASSTLDRGFASRNQLGMARRQLGSSFTGEDNEY
jgi:hypothetical protein